MMHFENFIQVERKHKKKAARIAGQAIMQGYVISFRSSLGALLGIP